MTAALNELLPPADASAEEKLILMQLGDIRRAYAAQAAPYIDRLARLRAARMPTIRVRADMLPADLLLSIKNG